MVTYSFTLSGLSGVYVCALDDNNPCSELHGTYTITNSSDDCIWLFSSSQPGAVTCPTGVALGATLSCDATNWIFIVSTNKSVGATYTKSRASWDCLAANTLDRATQVGCSSSWPATITLTPV